MLYTFIILILGVLFYLFVEYRVHRHYLLSIPIRVHVNGTRGKSSVTRLIAAALRAQGIRTFAKTTGTLPRMIMDDGREYPIYRPSRANIIEQLRIVSLAAHNKAEALVIECMALQPILQSLTELKFVRATHGVITNARADHLDVMGPQEKDVAMALLGTVPVKGKLFTAERDYLNEFDQGCRDRGSDLVSVTVDEIEAVTDEEMAGFSYVEHKENVALVLKISDFFGIPRETALRGMYESQPDPGAMSECRVSFFGREIIFVNGFAANDPESSERIWRMALFRHHNVEKKIMVLNTRFDRPDRSKQLGQSLNQWELADRYVLMGTGIYVLFRYAVESGIEADRFIYAEGMPVYQIFEEIVGLSGKSSMVMGIGNIGGPGLELVHYFHNRSAMK